MNYRLPICRRSLRGLWASLLPVALSAAPLLSTPVALAQTPSPAAAVLLDQGVAAVQQGDLAAAIAAFRQAT
ncbi:MAG: Tfp pilus assembly protein PilF, partial [Cyanobacteria bacterium P01_A01_bin.135]